MLYAIGALILIWAVWMPLKFRFQRLGRKPAELLFKALGTLTAVGFAAYAYFFSPQADVYTALILFALCLCTLADVFLEIRFIVGGVLFFLGHVLYAAGFFTLHQPTHWAALVLLVALPLLYWFLSRYRDRVPRLLYLGLWLYTAALGVLLAAALSPMFVVPSRRMLCAAVGAVLFVISDVTLCRNTIEKRGERADFISLGIYYTGQLFLAFSAFAG